MTASVLLVTHGRLSQQLLLTIEDMIGKLTLPTEVLEVRSVLDPDALVRQGERVVERMDSGEGVLLLTDAYGSTPSNIATRIGSRPGCRVVAGLNLPMLIKIYNYPQLDVEALARAAVEAGRRGIVLCDHPGQSR